VLYIPLSIPFSPAPRRFCFCGAGCQGYPPGPVDWGPPLGPTRWPKEEQWRRLWAYRCALRSMRCIAAVPSARPDLDRHDERHDERHDRRVRAVTPGKMAPVDVTAESMAGDARDPQYYPGPAPARTAPPCCEIEFSARRPFRDVPSSPVALQPDLTSTPQAR